MDNVKQKRWAVLIGIDSYHESLGNLKYAGADCRHLKKVLTDGNLGFDDDHVLLLDSQQADERKATFANMHTWLSSYLSQPKEDDLVLFYFAGHGREMDGKSYLIPEDATLSTLHTLGIPLANIQELMTRCKAKDKILIIDACHSGAGRDVALMSPKMETVLNSSKGIYTIASCAADELSHEWDSKKQGVFSYFLCEALGGGCIVPSGNLTIESIYEYIHDKVSTWAAKHRCKQSPQRFYHGSGTIILDESEPDHNDIVEQLKQQLALSKQELQVVQTQVDKEKATRLLLEQEIETFITTNPKLSGIQLQKKLLKHLSKKLSLDNINKETVLPILEIVKARQVMQQNNKPNKTDKIYELNNKLEATKNVIIRPILLVFSCLIFILLTAFSIFMISEDYQNWEAGIILGGFCILLSSYLLYYYSHDISTLKKRIFMQDELRILKYGKFISVFIRTFKRALIACSIVALMLGIGYASQQVFNHYNNLAIDKIKKSAHNTANKINRTWNKLGSSPNYFRKEFNSEIASIDKSIKMITLGKMPKPKTRHGWEKRYVYYVNLLARANSVVLQADRHSKGIWVAQRRARPRSSIYYKDLWAWEENSSREVKLCDNIKSFALSPDKKRVAYDDRHDIYVVNINGSKCYLVSTSSYIRGWENNDILILTDGRKLKLNNDNAVVKEMR